MHFPDVIQQVAAFVGCPAPEPDARGHLRFKLDGRPLALRPNALRDAFSLQGVVGRLNDGNFEHQASALLAANMRCEPSAFAVDDKGVAYLTQAFRLERLQAEAFEAHLQAFAARVVRWGRQLDALHGTRVAA